VEELGTPGSRRDVSVSLDNIGDIAKSNGDLETALAHYEESLTIARALSEELGTPESRRDVSVSLDNIGDIAKSNGDLETALLHYEESLAIRRALVEELGTPGSRRDVSLSLDRVGNIAKSNGDLEAALAHYEESLELCRALVEELGTPDSRRDLSVSLDRVGDIAQAHGDLETALAHYEESLAIDRALHVEFALEGDLNELVWNTGVIATLLLKQGNAREAERRLDEWRDLVGKLEASEDSNLVDTAAAHWEHKAACAEALGRIDEARAHAARAVELRNQIAAMNSDSISRACNTPALLDGDVAGIQVEEIAGADALLDRARSLRILALVLSLVLLSGVSLAWIWRVRQMRSNHIELGDNWC